ncbi:hypothetical protein [Bradyrhizobium sp. USDA 4350]
MEGLKTDLMTALQKQLRVILDRVICPPRFYSTRETAFGTASYDVLLRSRGPLGVASYEQRQNAILSAGVAMGIVTKDDQGNFALVEG